MLTGKEIIRRQSIGDIIIDPFDEKKVNPNSYNLTLNNKLLVYDTANTEEILLVKAYREVMKEIENDEEYDELKEKFFNDPYIQNLTNSYNLIKDKSILDMKKDNPTLEFTISDAGFILLPNKLYLGKTNEYTETHNLIPSISGRSSIGRLGINIHATAGFGDIGFKGNWTLEIFVTQPIVIYPNVEICQIYYYEPNGEIVEYNGRYQNSYDVHSSRLHRDYK